MTTDHAPSWTAKLEWARKHLGALDIEVSAFFADKPIRARVEIDRNAKRIRVWGELAKEMPAHWPLMVGDIVHSLRGSLDHIVWALSSKNPGFATAPDGQRRQVQFPICTTAGEYFGNRKSEGQRKRRARFINSAPLAVIDSLQPHTRGNAANDQALSILNELSNEDKHHTVLIAAMVVHLPYISFEGLGGPVLELATFIKGTGLLADETPLLEVRFHAPIPEGDVKVEPITTGQIALYKEGPDGWTVPAVEFLKETENRIGRLIIPLFSQYL